MTWAFSDITVTTWRRDEQGRMIWRARDGVQVVEFRAPRHADPMRLYHVAKRRLERAVTPAEKTSFPER